MLVQKDDGANTENENMSLKGKTIFLSGASRGIGRAIALKAAADGANIIVAAKTAQPHPKLPGTIHSVAQEIEQAGGQALPVVVDIRNEEMVEAAVEAGVKEFGGIDILVNNASAIFLTGTLHTPMKRYDLVHDVNVRGTFMCSQKCLPHLINSENPHILNMSPPLNMDSKWFAPHVAYTMSKFGMSMCVLGMAREFERDGVGVNALWPRTTIATSAVRYMVGGEEMIRMSRKPDILADAAYWILTQDSKTTNGNFFIDDEVMERMGKTDLSEYAVDPDVELAPDFFVEPN